MEDIPDDRRSPPLRWPQPRRWWHGSPLRLDRLAVGSTVTPIVELARAFSHKPSCVDIRVEERSGCRLVTIRHSGSQHGFLYEVLVNDPAQDLRQHPESGMACGEEMLTTRELSLRFIVELPLDGDVELRIAEPADA